MLKKPPVKSIVCLLLAVMMLMPLAACQPPIDDVTAAVSPTPEEVTTEPTLEPEATEEAPATTAAEATEAPTQAATEAAKTDAPKTQAPKTEAPKTSAPKTETPKTQTPKTDAPKTEAPKTEPPKTDPPKTEKPSSIQLPEWPTTLSLKDTHGRYAGRIQVTKMSIVDNGYHPTLYVNCKNVNSRTVDNLYLKFRCYDDDGVMLKTALIWIRRLPAGETGIDSYGLPKSTVRIEYDLDASRLSLD